MGKCMHNVWIMQGKTHHWHAWIQFQSLWDVESTHHTQ